MTKTLLVAGTASHVGKSVITAGLCRYLHDEGYDVAPFKGQNMSNNARVALSPDGKWGEIGVSQYVQAKAANVIPTTDMNPVLLKPRGDGESQLVVQGEALEHVSAGNYYETHWEVARSAVKSSFERLADEYEVIVAEGAGSIAEINLHHRDLANVETAEIADASIILVADIERGGVFASIYGTLELMPAALRDRVVGVIINKFRGDRSLLDPGIAELEQRTGVSVLGILPYDDPGLPEEDSVSIPAENEQAVVGVDAVPADQSVTIAVPRLPHISNFTDLEPLAAEPGVRIQYLPLDGTLGDADAVVIPGTKNTVDDVRALLAGTLGAEIQSFSGPIVGLCGGYQMLGERITNATIESTDEIATVETLGLLPVETEFSHEKEVAQVTREVAGTGLFAGVSGTISGYEIHMGQTRATGPVSRPLGCDSAGMDRIVGTYLHGLFENKHIRTAFLERVFEQAGVRRPASSNDVHSPYDSAATLVLSNIEMSALFDGKR